MANLRSGFSIRLFAMTSSTCERREAEPTEEPPNFKTVKSEAGAAAVSSVLSSLPFCIQFFGE